eukprot:7190179-Pyramimonas_sp.AAC.1
MARRHSRARLASRSQTSSRLPGQHWPLRATYMRSQLSRWLLFFRLRASRVIVHYGCLCDAPSRQRSRAHVLPAQCT